MIHQVSYNFKLDVFQQKAIEAVENDCSIVVSAPTGSGKTVIAEYVIKKCLNQGYGVIYTAPIKALSNQKFREFKMLFPDQVGIITGDVSINPSAPFLIMTTEIFRNRILENDSSFAKHSWIIFDEIHYLDDIERGTVWEESLIFLPKHMRFVGLSATIPNLTEFCSWLKEIHRNEITMIKEENRPVPLHHYFQCRGKIFNNLLTVKRVAYRGERGFHYGRNYGISNSHYLKKSSLSNKPERLMTHLLKSDRLPCIYFAFSRKRCEFLALRALDFDFITLDEKALVLKTFDTLCLQLGIEASERAQTLRKCIEKGVAYHHAGLHPLLKEVIEQLFSRRLIKLIFTTETFALGINMPARTVVLDDLKKKYGRFYRHLKRRDFSQMAGRSGRRGIDKEGFVYSRINPDELSFQELKQIYTGYPEPILSRFNISYATILSLYEIYGDQLIDIYPRSFHFFQQKNKKRSNQLEQIKSRLKILKQLEYIKNNGLTEKGLFAKKIYGYELPLSELFGSGLLETFTAPQLAMICLSMVYEPRPRRRLPKWSREVKNMKSITNQISKHINLIETRFRINPLSKKWYYDLVPSLVLWMDNKSFDEIMTFANHDEGEVIRFYRMCLQILREIKDAPIPDNFERKVDEAIEMINRGVINAEQQLKQVSTMDEA